MKAIMQTPDGCRYMLDIAELTNHHDAPTEIPETDEKAAETEKFIVVFDNSDHVVGFINGLRAF